MTDGDGSGEGPAGPAGRHHRRRHRRSRKGMGTVWKQTFRRDNTEQYPKEIVPLARALAHRAPPAQQARERPGEVHRVRAVRVRVPGGRDLGRGRRQRPGGPDVSG